MNSPQLPCRDFASLQEVLRAAGQHPGDPLTQTLDEARAQFTRFLSYLAGPVQLPPNFCDVTLPPPDSGVRIRVVQPRRAIADIPVVYLRGGGWWAGSLDSSLPLLSGIAEGCGLPVCAVDYRATPQFRYPAQVQDAIAGLGWIRANGKALALSQERCVIWGESAGATLAACAALEVARLTEETSTMRGLGAYIGGLVLLYGNFAGPRPELSPRSHWIWGQYLSDQSADIMDRAVVLRQSVERLPPCWIAVGDMDPLLADSVNLSSALHAKGIAHTLRVYPGLPHSFFPMARLLAPAKEATQEAYCAVQKFATRSVVTG